MELNSESGFDYATVRKDLHDKIHEAITDSNDEITGITGWILIVESAYGPKKRSLLSISGDILGDVDIPTWTARGWLDEVSENIDYFLGPDFRDDDEDEEVDDD